MQLLRGLFLMSSGKLSVKKSDKPARKRREYLLIVLVVIILLLFPRFEAHLSDFTSQLPISNSIIAMALINLNILLVLVFLFLNN